MAKEIIETLDALEPLVNDLVTTIETLRDLETDEEGLQADLNGVKKKLDDGTISKNAFDKITAKSKTKLADLKKEKKEHWDQLIGNLNSITDMLSKVKEQYGTAVQSK